MDPMTIAMAFSLIEKALAAAPALIADYEAARAAGKVSPADAAVLDAQIDSLESQRQVSWRAADAALDAAALT